MANFNKVILVGNLTRDPEMRYTSGGSAVATLGLAVNHRYGTGDDKKEETLFVDVVVFGKQAENVEQYLKKGRSVLVEGRLSYRTWEGKDGQKKSKHEVVANIVQFLSPRGAAEGPSSGQDEAPPPDDDNIPF
jgi:single-strand DNA-binding protein